MNTFVYNPDPDRLRVRQLLGGFFAITGGAALLLFLLASLLLLDLRLQNYVATGQMKW